MMEMHNLIDVLTGMVIVGLGWFLRENYSEQKRIQILLNKTREEYATKIELRDDMGRMIEAMRRIEDKIDTLMTK